MKRAIATSVIIEYDPELKDMDGMYQDIGISDLMDKIKIAISRISDCKIEFIYPGCFAFYDFEPNDKLSKCSNCGCTYRNVGPRGDFDEIPGIHEGGMWGESGLCAPCDTVLHCDPIDINTEE